MSAPTTGRRPARLCPGCLAPFSTASVERAGGMPGHLVVLPDGGKGPTCPGAGRPPREPGAGRSHTVIV